MDPLKCIKCYLLTFEWYIRHWCERHFWHGITFPYMWEMMTARLTQHAHPQHEGIHGVGETPGSPSCTRWEHHLLGLGLLTFYLCRQTSTHTHRQTIRLCRVHNQTDLTGLSQLFKVLFYLTCTSRDVFRREKQDWVNLSTSHFRGKSRRKTYNHVSPALKQRLLLQWACARCLWEIQA